MFEGFETGRDRGRGFGGGRGKLGSCWKGEAEKEEKGQDIQTGYGAHGEAEVGERLKKMVKDATGQICGERTKTVRKMGQ